MKRFVFFTFSLVFVVMTAAYIEGAPTLVENSKHNLSSYDPLNKRTIKSAELGGTQEICVFCHTPHSARQNDAPLWNRTNVTGPYNNTYWSDVLAGLSYPAPEDPSNNALPNYAVHAKTRICLSCHDGTIALGSLVNLPSEVTSGEVPMVGTAGSLVPNAMPPAAAGYIGTDFRDDHPVAIKYVTGAGSDPELSAALPAELKLYASGGFNYIECTTCHNPHDNQYGNFLVMSNDHSGMCTSCHNKSGYEPSSVHALTSAQSYSPSNGTAGGTLGTTVGGGTGVKCMACHFPHKAGITDVSQLPGAAESPADGKYLLSFKEEQSCYNSPDRWNNSTAPCHGDNGQAVKNIKSLVAASKPSRHQVDMNGTALHEATEAKTAGWLGAANTKWHVECADCHNPHTAGATSHTVRPPVPVAPGLPTLTSSSSLYGAGGVQVNAPPTWAGGQGSYTYIEPIGVIAAGSGVSYEYQICMKCHSEFAWRTAGTAPNSPSFVPAAAMTDQAKEFMNSSSFHPVTAVTGRTAGTHVGSWNANKGNQTMYCSDCHNNNAAPPQGPHGSGNKFVLVANFTDMYSARGGGDAQKQPNGDLCFVCHDQNTYSQTSNALNGGTNFTAPGGLNLHAMHAWRVPNFTIPGLNPWPYRCVNCHARVPHGINRNAMIVLSTDPAPYVATDAVLGGGKINAYTMNSSNYVIGNCTTANGCHQAGP